MPEITTDYFHWLEMESAEEERDYYRDRLERFCPAADAEALAEIRRREGAERERAYMLRTARRRLSQSMRADLDRMPVKITATGLRIYADVTNDAWSTLLELED